MKEEDKQAILEFQANRCRSCRNRISSPDQAVFVQNLSRREGGKSEDPSNQRALCTECKSTKVAVTFTLSDWENDLLNDIVEEFSDIFKSRSHFIRTCIENYNFRKLRKNKAPHEEREEFLSDNIEATIQEGGHWFRNLESRSYYAKDSAGEISREIEYLLSTVETIRIIKNSLEEMNETLVNLQKTSIFDPRKDLNWRIDNNSRLRKFMDGKKEYPNREDYSSGSIPTDDF